jgi:hypothetical protein
MSVSAGVDEDVLERYAEDLGGDLAEDGVAAGTEVGRPDQQVERRRR